MALPLPSTAEHATRVLNAPSKNDVAKTDASSLRNIMTSCQKYRLYDLTDDDTGLMLLNCERERYRTRSSCNVGNRLRRPRIYRIFLKSFKIILVSIFIIGIPLLTSS